MINNQQSNRRSMKKAFTLVEIMIVVAIIALLASIGIPNLKRARDMSNYAYSVKFIRTVAEAAEQYHMDHGDYPNDLTSLSSATPPYLAPNMINDLVSTGTPWYYYHEGRVVYLSFDTSGDEYRFVACFRPDLDHSFPCRFAGDIGLQTRIFPGLVIDQRNEDDK